MSVREEDSEEKNRSVGAGFAIAGAVIGVGVGIGSLMYYLFNKKSESETAMRQWQSEQTLFTDSFDDSTDSDINYLTVSEHTTTDTSINEDTSENYDSDEPENDFSDSDEVEVSDSSSLAEVSDSSSLAEVSESDYDDDTNVSLHSDDGWDVTFSFADTPVYVPYVESRSPLRRLVHLITSNSANRNRSNTLELCSVCVEEILEEQEVMVLGCTHRFHTKCILPWVQQRQSCPNCRKNI